MATLVSPEDTLLTISLTNAAFVARTFTISALPANGALYLDAAMTKPVALNAAITAVGGIASVYFMPAANWNGSTSLSYSAVKGKTTAVATQAITVTPVNDAPTLSGAQTALSNATEDASLTLTTADLLQGWTDADGDPLSIANLVASNGTLTDNGNGTWTFMPGANFNGTVSLGYQVTDGQGGVSAASQSFTVTAVNDAPVAAAAAAALPDQLTSQAFSVPLPAGLLTDPDGDALTYSATLADGSPLPAWLNCDPVSGTLSGNPGALATSTQFSIVVSASDGQVVTAAPALSLKFFAGGTVNLTALPDKYVGSIANERIFGWGGNDTINAGAGNDYLDGGIGTDTMIGGQGNDIYVIDNAFDSVIELANEGIDTIQTTLNLPQLPAQVENLTLTGNAANSLTGNELNNLLTGNSAANRIDGGLGADRMVGGNGNDSYVVDNAGDVIVETALGGLDAISSSVSYVVPVSVESLTLTGNAVAALGNAAPNAIVGNAADNVIGGNGGSDILTGGAGNDQFVFTTAPGLGNVDLVVDFTAGDHLVFDAFVFQGLGAGAQTLATGAGASAALPSDHLIFDTTSKALYYDADGSGATAAVQVATLTGVSALTMADVFIGNSTLAAANPTFGHIDAATGLLMV
jgi:Ca2+-binding RTX toxin-like protein